jgi:hypothetical protein
MQFQLPSLIEDISKANTIGIRAYLETHCINEKARTWRASMTQLNFVRVLAFCGLAVRRGKAEQAEAKQSNA